MQQSVSMVDISQLSYLFRQKLKVGSGSQQAEVVRSSFDLYVLLSQTALQSSSLSSTIYLFDERARKGPLSFLARRQATWCHFFKPVRLSLRKSENDDLKRMSDNTVHVHLK